MEGDWGGQIYLTVPVRLVRCSHSALESLLEKLDAHAWSCNEGEGRGVYFERHSSFEGVSGGMGGGVIVADLWLHPELAAFEQHVRDVLAANTPSNSTLQPTPTRGT